MSLTKQKKAKEKQRQTSKETNERSATIYTVTVHTHFHQFPLNIMKFSTANTFYILFLLQATSILNVHAVAVTDNHDESIVVQPTTTTTETATTVRNNRSLRGSGEGATTLKTNQRRSLSATGSCVLPIYAGIKNYCFST